MTPALAYLESDLESDPSPIQGITTECARCDPDNPLAVAREKCPDCKGTGRTLIALAAIVEEMKESRLELLIGSKKPNRGGSVGGDYDDDYIDPDDCI